MEKCKGNLKSHIFEHPESVAGKSENPAAVLKVCQWVKEITAALAYIHERGLVHKGLLLESILVTKLTVLSICHSLLTGAQLFEGRLALTSG